MVQGATANTASVGAIADIFASYILPMQIRYHFAHGKYHENVFFKTTDPKLGKIKFFSGTVSKMLNIVINFNK